MWGAEDPTKNGEDSSEEEDDDEEEDSDDEDGTSAAKEEASREARKAQKKARKEAAIAKAKGKTVEVGDMPTSDEEEDEDDEDDDMPANPNHSKAARKQAKAPTAADEDADVDEVTDGVKKLQAGNRKEREALEAAAAKERYLKMQAQGKTDEAKADLARLKVIREQRAAEAARRQVSRTLPHPVSPQTCIVFETCPLKTVWLTLSIYSRPRRRNGRPRRRRSGLRSRLARPRRGKQPLALRRAPRRSEASLSTAHSTTSEAWLVRLICHWTSTVDRRVPRLGFYTR